MFNIDTATFGLNNHRFPPVLMPRAHRHSEVEFNFLESGSMTYLFGGTSVTLLAGQLALFWAAIPHQVVHVQEESVLHWVTIPFTTFLRWRLPAFLMQQVMCGEFIVNQEEDTRQFYQHLIRQWDIDLRQNVEELRCIVLLELEACLRRMALSSVTKNTSSSDSHGGFTDNNLQHVGHMASFIAEHYPEPLSIDHIARKVHLNPNYAMSLFRKSVGMSIVDYITQYRIAHAQRLLITTNATILEIATASGFGSISRFYTAFKDICDMSPGGYRELHHI